MSNKLDLKVYSCFGSINDNEKILNENMIAEFFTNYAPCQDYFIIKHDDTETLHYHYLLKLSKQVRLSTIINFISSGLNINPLAVNIDKCRGFNICLRYMIHVDDSSKLDNKKVYEPNNIVSNRQLSEVINLLQCDDDDEISWEVLIKGVIRYSKTSDLIKFFGLKNYHKYRFEIRDLLEEKLNSPKFNMEYSYLNDDVPF